MSDVRFCISYLFMIPQNENKAANTGNQKSPKKHSRFTDFLGNPGRKSAGHLTNGQKQKQQTSILKKLFM